jgi:hypothetical protein|nr:MAG TPA: hypothetical protein [Caudoviricetes sp.]
MARVIEPITDEQLKQITVANLRKEYKKIADFYRKIINNEIVYCSHCRNWKTVRAFYESAKSPDGIEHYACKECILNECTDVGKNGIRSDNKEKTIETFRKLDWYFDEKVYNAQLQKLSDGTGEKIRSTAVQQLIVVRSSLNDYSSKTFSESIFDIDDIEISPEENTRIIQKTLKKAKKRFGNYSNEDLMYLENEYQDWTTRYQCENKSQELLFKRICFKELEIDKAQKEGKDTKELDATLQNLMGSLNIKPSQKTSNALTDNLTFGQLIDKWEQSYPVPEPDEDFKDVDKIGLYIDVFFKGHLSKMMGLKNAFSSLYDRFMSKYTVKKPQYDEDFDSETLFDQIFGSKMDEEG